MAMYSNFDDYIKENSHLGQRPLARKIIKEFGLDQRCFNGLRKHIYLLNKKSDTPHSALEAYCEDNGIPVEDVNHYWHKGQHFSIHVKGSEEESLTDEDIKDAVSEALLGFEKVYTEKKEETNESALKVVISDAHVGLDPDPEGESLFGYQYSDLIFYDHLEDVYQNVIKKFKQEGTFDTFFLYDLGDGLDGYNKQTTRGGHSLDQNLSNKEAFNAYVKGKFNLIKRIIEAGVANRYEIHNVSNCNHSGDFGWAANRTIQLLIEHSIEADVDFVILDKFMQHHTYGDHCFILTHGKDKKYMKHGFPLVLNADTINKIRDYIDVFDIRSKYIHLEKGDLHQVGYQRTKKFDYRNFMTFAPPSAWVTTNFGDTYAGYSVQVVPKHSNKIQHTDHFFELKRKG